MRTLRRRLESLAKRVRREAVERRSRSSSARLEESCPRNGAEDKKEHGIDDGTVGVTDDGAREMWEFLSSSLARSGTSLRLLFGDDITGDSFEGIVWALDYGCRRVAAERARSEQRAQGEMAGTGTDDGGSSAFDNVQRVSRRVLEAARPGARGARKQSPSTTPCCVFYVPPILKDVLSRCCGRAWSSVG